MLKILLGIVVAFITLSLIGISPVELFALDKMPAHIAVFLGATIAVIWGIMYDA